MTYFKKLTFDSAAGKISFHKVKVQDSQLVDDGIESVDLKFEHNSDDMQRIEISKESTTAGTVYAYTVTADAEQEGVYLFQTNFGYIDSNNPTVGNLFPISFGKFRDTSIALDEVVSPPTSQPTRSISGHNGKLGCVIGESDLDQLPPMPPIVAVMEGIELYIGLEEKGTEESKTYYDLKIQRKALPES